MLNWGRLTSVPIAAKPALTSEALLPSQVRSARRRRRPSPHPFRRRLTLGTRPPDERLRPLMVKRHPQFSSPCHTFRALPWPQAAVQSKREFRSTPGSWLVRGYVNAVERFREQAATGTDSAREIYPPLFEALNWAHSLWDTWFRLRPPAPEQRVSSVQNMAFGALSALAQRSPPSR